MHTPAILMRNIHPIDISDYSFSEFLRFVFDRDVQVDSERTETPLSAREKPWFYDTRTTLNPRRLNSYYIELFCQPKVLLKLFSAPQLEQGFRAIQSGCTFSVKRLLWNTDLAFEHREECVRSMVYLFRDFFRVEQLGFTACMWWDGFCFAWEAGIKKRSRGGEDLAMQDVMFEAIT